MSQSDDRVWRRPTRCDTGTCVEVAFEGDDVFVRNSTHIGDQVLFTKAEWMALWHSIADDGEFAA